MIEGAFLHRRFFFPTGLRAGEIATIRSEAGESILTYRSFASIVGVVATLVGAIVGAAGLAGAALLVAEHAPFRALLALILTGIFTLLIFRLVPRKSVTLFDGRQAVLTIAQLSTFPSSRYAVSTPDGHLLGQLSRGMLTRLLRNRWIILQDDRPVAEAFEHPTGAAVARKLLGKFSRRWEADVRIEQGSLEAGHIRRRPDEGGQVDYLELTGEALDPRLAVAAATIILGSEP